MQTFTDAVPLDHIKVTSVNSKTDELEEVPALHRSLCKENSFSGILYQKIELIVESDLEQCCSVLNQIAVNLHWLLSLQYERFWCQVVNDQSVHACLDSYLRLGPRFHQSDWPMKLVEAHSLVHRAVFMVFLRMSTLKESSQHFMSKSLFSKLVYDNYLFDIPRLMDLCSLYGVPENRPLLKKMIENLFNNQQRFYDDLSQAAATVSQVLLQIEQKCLGTTGGSAAPSKLSSRGKDAPLLAMGEKEFADVVCYISDTTKTLERFIVDVFTDATTIFYEHKLIDRLVTLYSEVLPAVRSALAERERTIGGELALKLRCLVKQSRDSLLKVVNGTVRNLAYLPATQAAKEKHTETTEEYVEKYFQVLSSLLSSPRFFSDFCRKFNTRWEVETLKELCPNVAETHSEFLFQAIEPMETNPLQSRSVNGVVDHTTSRPLADEQPCTSKSTDDVPRSALEDVKAKSAVSSVRDVLPDLADDFVRKCLAYYEMNPEKVIQAIFEQNLPPHLSSIRQTSNADQERLEAGSSKEADRRALAEVDLLHDRKNVFDGDEFDVFAKGVKIDKSRVHYGKQNREALGHWADEPDQDVEKLRLMYSRYGVGAEHMNNDTYLLRDDPISIYDDEYDDTYDDADVAANDADSVDELGEDEKEEKMQKDQPRDNNRSRDFVENPETVRARQADMIRKREEYFASRGGKGRKHTRPSAGRGKDSAPPQDGVANDKSTEKKNREYKNARGSHNRKALATKKSNKGMFMSR